MRSIREQHEHRDAAVAAGQLLDDSQHVIGVKTRTPVAPFCEQRAVEPQIRELPPHRLHRRVRCGVQLQRARCQLAPRQLAGQLDQLRALGRRADCRAPSRGRQGRTSPAKSPA